jgi:hypothetical protein
MEHKHELNWLRSGNSWVCCDYVILKTDQGFVFLHTQPDAIPDAAGLYPTEAEAKAAAQEDREARIQRGLPCWWYREQAIWEDVNGC